MQLDTTIKQAMLAQPVLQSSTEQSELQFALNNALVHRCWVTARCM